MKRTKAKIIGIIVAIFVLVMSASLIINASVIDNPTIIEFQDEVLYEMVKLELTSKPNDIKIQVNKDDETIPKLGIRLSDDDLNLITKLTLQGVSGYQVTNLNGIERFVNLTELDVSGNAIVNVEKILQLTKLEKFDISGNNLSGTNDGVLNTLSQMTGLTSLNLANTKIDSVEAISTLINLKELTLSGNNLNTLSPISGLINLTKLDISNNRSLPTLGHIQTLELLEELNISNTGITNLYGIQEFEQLRKLYASNITGLTKDDDRLASLYSVKEDETIVLSKLEVLDLSSSGITETTDADDKVIQSANQAKVDFKKLSAITTLKELYLENMGITSLNGLANFANLQILDLANNKIKSDHLEDLIIEKNDIVQEDNVLKATHIELQENDIIDLSIFGKYPGNIEYLDLRKNHIYNTQPLSKHSLSERIDLRQQDIQFSIYDKAVDVNHYIILPEILKSSKIQGSLVYTENDFTTTGIQLNPNYTQPSEYNVIISPEKTKNDTLSIKINGGNADGTTLKYVVGLSASSSHNGYVTESLFFNDDNLYQEILNEIDNNPKYKNYIGDSREVLPNKIININRKVIDQIDLLYIDNKSIKDVTGLENCSKLTDLYLSGNDISTINPLSACTLLVKLNLANNKNLKDNNSAIENMSKLTYLDLSNTGMTNINSINNLTNNLKTIKLYELVISGNGLQDINGIENIKSLGKLEIANEQLDDEDMDVLKNLTTLTTLDISGNQISDLSALTNLKNLTHLYLSKNSVESLEPLRGKIFTELDFESNKVKDITPLSSHNSINRLYMANNQIEDITILDNISIENEFSVGGQKIIKSLNNNSEGEVSVQLPQIFKAAKIEGNKIFTSADLEFTNCELDSSGENIIISMNSENTEVAKVKINGGKATQTTLTVAIPLKAEIQYSIPNDTPTQGNVTATISFNRTNVTILNNDGKNTYTFTDNGQFTFKYVDEYGFEGTATAVVENIDKVQPQGIVTQTVKDGKVIVTIQVSEEIAEISGWEKTINKDGKIILTKVYEADSTETVKLVDLAGNESNVKVEVTIDKTAPKITGVADGEKYSTSVTPQVEDQSEVTIKLTKDGSVISNYKIGTPITDAGLYVLTVTDAFGNTTTVSFEIEISDIITSDEITVAEQELVIKNIDPKTTVLGLKSLLEAQMDYTIIDKNGNVVSKSAKVGTGYQIKMPTNKIYTLIVRGDCNGDGDATITDIFSINSHRLKVKSLSGIYLQAADVNDDSKADIKDIFKINSYRLQGGEL